MTLKERILKTSFSLACEQGINAIAVSEVARRLEVSKGSVTSHFKTNEALRNGACLYIKDEYWQQTFEIAQKEKPGTGAIRTLFLRFLHWMEQCDGCDPWVMSAAELHAMSPRLKDQVVGAQRMFQLSIRQLIHAAINEGELVTDLDIDRFIFEFSSAMLAFQLYCKWRSVDYARKMAMQSLNELMARHKNGG